MTSDTLSFCPGPSSDGFLRRKLREIIRHYFFRLIRLTKNDIRKHPLFECIVHLKNAEPIAEEMAGLFLKVKDRIPDSQALHVSSPSHYFNSLE